MTTTTLAPVHAVLDAQGANDWGKPSPADHAFSDAQSVRVGGGSTSDSSHGLFDDQTSDTAIGTHRAESIGAPNAHTTDDSAPSSGGSQSVGDAQLRSAAAGSNSPTGNSTGDAQARSARGGHTSTGLGAMSPATPSATPPRPGGWLRDPVLGVLADVLNDLETVRTANANRVATLTRVGADADGEERGHGLTVDHPEVAKLALTVQALEAAEHDTTLNLQRAMRKHPLGPWVKSKRGIGEKQAARLLAVLGDPYWNDLHGRPRTVSQLRAYAGLHVLHPGGQNVSGAQESGAAGVAPKRQRGQKGNWSEDARKRTWLIAVSCMKAGGEYREVYDEGRAKYADAVHLAECVRCGPQGKPALLGSPLSLGHQHARALRLVSKAILRDLWIESRNLHEGSAV